MKKESLNSRATSPKPISRKYVSSMEVARLAGVSQSAVSRTFTEGASVSESTRRKVMDAANAIGYQPNSLPRILQNQRSSLIAIVIGGMHNPFYATIVEMFTRRLQESGNTVLLFAVKHGEYFDDVIPQILGYRVDGIISALSLLTPEKADRSAITKIPIVLFNGKIRNDYVASVCADNVAGGRDVARLFLECGATRFGFIGGKKGNLATEDRMSGYVGHLAAAGIGGVKVGYGNYQFEGGFDAAKILLGKRHRPNALFCANDLMAIGALEAARAELGLRVPEDLMIAGFDDILPSRWPCIQLTTVRQDAVRMVDEALEILERMIEGDGLESTAPRVVAAPLIERKTTPSRGNRAK
jgi:DNA-binding LacI/PurR family transcriptional regulator